jgi:chromosome segregation ATPase
MSTYDPRTLIRILGVLEEEVQRFTQASSDTLKQAEYTQGCAQERINQALRWSAIASNQVKSDLEDVQKIEAEVSSLLTQCSTAIEAAHETLAIVNQAQQRAESTLNHWENELQMALAWQARAEARLERAIQIYQQAQRNLESARSALNRAESSLQRCINDPERKNCNSEERAYNNAKAAVLVALEELQEAEIEVHSAQEELERAKARVRCCQNAVNYAKQAVHHAELAVERANQAVNGAERSLESVESANRAATNAQSKATEAEQQAEQLLIKVHQAEAFTNEAQIHSQTARNMADSAHRLSSIGMQELRYRISQLTKLNQASSGFWGAVEKGVAAVQIAGGLLGGVVSAPVPDGRLLGLQSQEDLVLEAGSRASSVNEDNVRRREEELDTSARVANEPTTSSPPDP